MSVFGSSYFFLISFCFFVDRFVQNAVTEECGEGGDDGQMCNGVEYCNGQGSCNAPAYVLLETVVSLLTSILLDPNAEVTHTTTLWLSFFLVFQSDF